MAAYGSQWAVPPFFTVVSTVLSCEIKITSLYKTTRNKQTKMDDVEKGNTNMKKSSSLQDVLGSKNNLKADSVFRCVVFCFRFFFVFFPFDDDDDDNGAQNALSRNQ